MRRSSRPGTSIRRSTRPKPTPSLWRSPIPCGSLKSTWTGTTVLLVDDILSNGQAILSLLELVSKAGGEVAGVGVAIEKAMRDGGRVLRRMGIRVEALATVERIEGDRIILKD